MSTVLQYALRRRPAMTLAQLDEECRKGWAERVAVLRDIWAEQDGVALINGPEDGELEGDAANRQQLAYQPDSTAIECEVDEASAEAVAAWERRRSLKAAAVAATDGALEEFRSLVDPDEDRELRVGLALASAWTKTQGA